MKILKNPEFLATLISMVEGFFMLKYPDTFSRDGFISEVKSETPDESIIEISYNNGEDGEDGLIFGLFRISVLFSNSERPEIRSIKGSEESIDKADRLLKNLEALLYLTGFPVKVK